MIGEGGEGMMVEEESRASRGLQLTPRMEHPPFELSCSEAVEPRDSE